MFRLLPVLLLLSCKPPPDPAPPGVEGPDQPLTDQPFTTLQGIWAPKVPPAATADEIDAGSFTVTELDRYEEMGLGVRWEGPVAWNERTELGPDFAEGTDRRSLLYLWQAADPQIIDEESPIRFEAWDLLYRPNGHLTAHSFEAHVASARRISEISGRPFDFAVIAGDLTDGSQANELGWFLKSLGGGGIDPDSGDDDDPIPGPGNDYNDPLNAVGLGVPWYAAIGNHETTYNGGFGQVDETLRAAATGTEVYEFPLFPNGFRDGSTEHAEIRTEGPTPADIQRTVLYREEVLSALHDGPGHPVGHGLSPDDVAEGRGYFSVHPIPGRPIRLVVLDTVHTYGITGEASMGYVSEAQFDWLQATLNEADDARELVLVMSHHRLKDLAGTSPISEDDLAGVLAASEGVFLLITGHGHANSEYLEPEDFDGVDPTLGFWQLMLASTIDFPQQSRIIEVVDERNGHLSIYCTNIDQNSPEGSLPHLARSQAAGKWAFGEIGSDPDVEGDWASSLEGTNLLLRIQIPDRIATSLTDYEWPTRIESEQTLSAL